MTMAIVVIPSVVNSSSTALAIACVASVCFVGAAIFNTSSVSLRIWLKFGISSKGSWADWSFPLLPNGVGDTGTSGISVSWCEPISQGGGGCSLGILDSIRVT